MVKVSIIRDSDSGICGFVVKGHAGFAKKGQDIVCSAVSALSYTGVGALCNMAGGCDYEEKNGFMRVFIKKTMSKEERSNAEIILNTIYIGFMQLKEDYPNFVNVCESKEEV